MAMGVGLLNAFASQVAGPQLTAQAMLRLMNTGSTSEPLLAQ